MHLNPSNKLVNVKVLGATVYTYHCKSARAQLTTTDNSSILTVGTITEAPFICSTQM